MTGDDVRGAHAPDGGNAPDVGRRRVVAELRVTSEVPANWPEADVQAWAENLARRARQRLDDADDVELNHWEYGDPPGDVAYDPPQTPLVGVNPASWDGPAVAEPTVAPGVARRAVNYGVQGAGLRRAAFEAAYGSRTSPTGRVGADWDWALRQEHRATRPGATNPDDWMRLTPAQRAAYARQLQGEPEAPPPPPFGSREWHTRARSEYEATPQPESEPESEPEPQPEPQPVRPWVVGDVCVRRVRADRRVGASCAWCGHTNFAHPGAPNPGLAECAVCRLVFTEARARRLLGPEVSREEGEARG